MDGMDGRGLGFETSESAHVVKIFSGNSSESRDFFTSCVKPACLCADADGQMWRLSAASLQHYKSESDPWNYLLIARLICIIVPINNVSNELSFFTGSLVAPQEPALINSCVLVCEVASL